MCNYKLCWYKLFEIPKRTQPKETDSIKEPKITLRSIKDIVHLTRTKIYKWIQLVVDKGLRCKKWVVEIPSLKLMGNGWEGESWIKELSSLKFEYAHCSLQQLERELLTWLMNRFRSIIVCQESQRRSVKLQLLK